MKDGLVILIMIVGFMLIGTSHQLDGWRQIFTEITAAALFMASGGIWESK